MIERTNERTNERTKEGFHQQLVGVKLCLVSLVTVSFTQVVDVKFVLFLWLTPVLLKVVLTT